MSDQIDDGGPAFPVAEDHKIASDLEWTCGMSMRDYFAGQVIGSLISTSVSVQISEAVSAAYQIADAMLAARKVKP